MSEQPAYDAVLLHSFGGPEGPDDVMPYLENVTRGRGIPRERLVEVAEHYHHLGGRSPINDQNRALLAALREDFAANGLGGVRLYWGNRNWHPFLADAVRQMAADGVRRALAFPTAGYSSYSSCRQYWEDIDRARAEAGVADPPVVDKIRHFYNHPGYVTPYAEGILAALAALPPDRRAVARTVFTAHSIPLAMAATAGIGQDPAGGLYVAELTETARLVADAVAAAEGRRRPWDLVWQSRSGPPTQPWLEPDIADHLDALAAAGTTEVVVSPIGFVSDHVEVVWDLDTEAAEHAAALGLGYSRAATAGVHPAFVAMVRELVVERLDPAAPRRVLGDRPVAPDVCADGCCPRPVRPAAGRR